MSSVHFQNFINNNDRERESEDQPPFVHIQSGDREDLSEDGYVDDHEVESHGYSSSSEQVDVHEGGHDEEGVVLRDGVEGIQHFDQHKDR